jgi:hypothetical protein
MEDTKATENAFLVKRHKGYNGTMKEGQIKTLIYTLSFSINWG